MKNEQKNAKTIFSDTSCKKAQDVVNMSENDKNKCFDFLRVDITKLT